MIKMKRLFLLAAALMLTGFASRVSAQTVPQWAREGVIYHIWPSAYMDSNNDGMGDLQGIRSRLDYIQSLGVSAIWMSPTFCSEFEDGGYDVTDYYKTDPRFGTNDDMAELIRDAHSRGIKVILDLVIGHSSDKNPWFIQSASGEGHQRYSDYYIWARDEDVDPERLDRRMVKSTHPRKGYYLKNHYDIQPALNFGYAHPNPDRPWEQGVDAPGPQAVRREVKNIIAFWLDMGIDGFRCDMAGSLVKGDIGSVETVKLWREIRTFMEERWPEAILLSEWSSPEQALKAGFHIDLITQGGVGRNLYVPMVGASPELDPRRTPIFFSQNGAGQSKPFADNYGKVLDAAKRYGGIAAMPTSSHDIWRLNALDRNTPEQLKVAMTFFFTLPETPILYYGEEIGMKTFEDAPVKEGSYAPHNRSNCRTPMQWDASRNAGFSTVTDPSLLYLPIDSDPARPTVSAQQDDPNSLLNYVRGLIALRRSNPVLGHQGEWEYVSSTEQPYPMIYKRFLGNEQYLVILNPRQKKAEVTLTGYTRLGECVYGDAKAVKASVGKKGMTLKVNGISAAVFKVE